MVPIIFIIQGILLRLLPHLPNAAPITAMGLFGGAKLSKRMALVLPFVTMVISDYLLLYVRPFDTPWIVTDRMYPLTALVHFTTVYVWSSFVISSLVGMAVRKHLTLLTVAGASLICSLQFFLITNFGVWMAGNYSRGIDGLVKSYVMGLPFLQGTIVGDLFYTGVFFGLFALAQFLAHPGAHSRSAISPHQVQYKV